jgi:predicted nucleic acid-binding Zn finger protein
MKINKSADHYKVKSESSNRWYDVFPERPFCSCPNFVFRSMRTGGICKHVAAVQELVGAVDTKIIDYVKKKGEVDSVDIIEKFGEEKVNTLIERGELVERAGKIRVLE